MPIPLPDPSILLAILQALFSILTGKQKEERAARERARESQEHLAAYHKWLNELRDAEIAAKASYEKAVQDFLKRYFDERLDKINLSLSSVNEACESHTENLRVLEQLQLRTGEEIAALTIAVL